jgi:hypothetical protein
VVELLGRFRREWVAVEVWLVVPAMVLSATRNPLQEVCRSVLVYVCRWVRVADVAMSGMQSIADVND